MKYYRNPVTGEIIPEGGRYVTRLPDGSIYEGTPTEAEFYEFGFGPYVPLDDMPEPGPLNPFRERMWRIKQALADMDYLTAKAMDGEDMSKYGDWQARRRALREEYNYLQARGNALQQTN